MGPSNPKYNDYYNEDMKATRASLEAEYGKMSDTDFALYTEWDYLSGYEAGIQC